MFFNFPERAGFLPYRDTELRLPAGNMTDPSPSAARADHEASRIVSVTRAGQAGLRKWLGVDL